MGFGDTCKKIIIVVLNLVFLIFGLCVLILGIIWKIDWDKYKDAFKDESEIDLKHVGNTISIACIVLGSFITLLAFAGCCGACFRNKCLLGIYGSVVLVLLIAEIVVIIIITTNSFGVQDKIDDALIKSLEGFNETLGGKNEVPSRGFAVLFHEFECCGVKNPVEEFKNTSMWAKSSQRTNAEKNANFPVVCCKAFEPDDYLEKPVDRALFDKPDIKTCLNGTKPNTDSAFVLGCGEKFSDFLDDQKPIVIGVGVGLLIVQFAVALFALCLMRDDDD